MKAKTQVTPMTDNVARMLPIGQGVEPPKPSFDHLNEVVETISPLVVDTDGNAIRPNDEPTAPAEPPANVDTGSTVPDKLKGKSAEELASMYANLESEIGRHRNEVGNMRKWVDNLLVSQANLTAKQPPNQPTASDEDLKKQEIDELNLMLTKPSAYRQKVKQELMNELQQVGQRATFDRMKRDSAQVLADPRFASWLTQNVSQEFAARADADPVLFNHLINQFKQTTEPTNQPTFTPTPAPAPANPGPAMGPGNNSRAGSKQVFSRSEMMTLFNSDPARYQALMPEYLQAIQEKRVKP